MLVSKLKYDGQMLIFIDESGTFTFSKKGSAISLVGTLTIPEDSFAKITQKYQKIRKSLPIENGEVKGRMLIEAQVDEIVRMLAKNDVLFTVACIDLSLHTKETLEAHRKKQVAMLTANLTSEHHENVICKIHELSDRLDAMALQLYIQSVLTFEAIHETVELSTLYYCQRRPKVLQKFEWVIDGKDANKLTDWEDWWSSTMMPIIQSKSFRNPIKQLESGDYSYFKRFYTDIPEYIKPHLNDPSEQLGLDMKLIMKESFRFSSDPEMGLELVDILTNATRRALIGNLYKTGWENIPNLMIHQKNNYIKLVGLGDFNSVKTVAYKDVLRHFTKNGKTLLTKKKFN